MTKLKSLTPEHKARFPEWRDRWIANAMSTKPMTEDDREACRAAVLGMYAAAGHPPPKHIEAGHYTSEDGGPRIMRSVVYARSCHGRAIHPTEKPVDLLEILIRTSCPPGAVLGDLFAGSGAAGEAARNAGRGYIGVEIDPGMAANARERLSSKLALVAV